MSNINGTIANLITKTVLWKKHYTSKDKYNCSKKLEKAVKSDEAIIL